MPFLESKILSFWRNFLVPKHDFWKNFIDFYSQPEPTKNRRGLIFAGDEMPWRVDPGMSHGIGWIWIFGWQILLTPGFFWIFLPISDLYEFSISDRSETTKITFRNRRLKWWSRIEKILTFFYTPIFENWSTWALTSILRPNFCFRRIVVTSWPRYESCQ